jgi:hypothetical protein
VQHASRHRISRRQPGEPVHRKLTVTRRQHEVAEPAAAQDRGVRDQAGLREGLPHGRDLRAGVRERRAVGHVGGEDPGIAQGPAGRRRELRRGEVGWRAAARENVRDHHVERARGQLLKHRPGVADANPDPAARAGARHGQPQPQKVKQCGVYLDGHLLRGWPGRCYVAGQGECPGAQVEHVQWLLRGCRRVDHVPQPPDVLELQVSGVVEVDVRLRDAVDQQHPRRAPVGVPQELGAAPAGVYPVAGVFAAVWVLRRLPPSGHSCHYRWFPARPGKAR